MKVGEIWTHRTLNYDVEIVELLWDSTVVYLRRENGEIIEDKDRNPIKEDEVCFVHLKDTSDGYSGEQAWMERNNFIEDFCKNHESR